MSTKYVSSCLLIITLLCVSCKVTQKQERPDSAVEALVIRSELAGCSWLLRTIDGQMLEPDRIDEKFQKDKLEIWLGFQVDKNRLSICMSGIPVNVSFIDLR